MQACYIIQAMSTTPGTIGCLELEVPLQSTKHWLPPLHTQLYARYP